MNELSAYVDAAFAKMWHIGGEAIPCRYRYKDDCHELKTHTGVLEKGTVCTSPDGVLFEVISSARFNTTTFRHVLQPHNDAPTTDWTPSR